MAKIRESEEHSKSKIMEHFLSGFKPDDSDWIKFLADVVFDIFCNYNYQMISLLKQLSTQATLNLPDIDLCFVLPEQILRC